MLKIPSMPQICHNEFWLLVAHRKYGGHLGYYVNPRGTLKYIGSRPSRSTVEGQPKFPTKLQPGPDDKLAGDDFMN